MENEMETGFIYGITVVPPPPDLEPYLALSSPTESLFSSLNPDGCAFGGGTIVILREGQPLQPSP